MYSGWETIFTVANNWNDGVICCFDIIWCFLIFASDQYFHHRKLNVLEEIPNAKFQWKRIPMCLSQVEPFRKKVIRNWQEAKNYSRGSANDLPDVIVLQMGNLLSGFASVPLFLKHLSFYTLVSISVSLNNDFDSESITRKINK